MDDFRDIDRVSAIDAARFGSSRQKLWEVDRWMGIRQKVRVSDILDGSG